MEPRTRGGRVVKPQARSKIATSLGRRAAPSKAQERQLEQQGILLVSGGHCAYSPCGTLCAFSSGSSVVVTDNFTGPCLEVKARWSTSGAVDSLEWASNGDFLLVCSFSRAEVKVFSIQNKDWDCRITEGVAGLVGATFSPDASCVLTVAEFQMHISVWDLYQSQPHGERGMRRMEESGKASNRIKFGPTKRVIECPKLSSGGVFSSCGKYFAVLHRRECKDSVGIYNASSHHLPAKELEEREHVRWEMLVHFGIETSDAEELVWSPSNDSIVVRDSAVEYLLLVYSPASGDLIARFSAYSNALGIRSLAFQPLSRDSQEVELLAVGSFDGVVRFLSTATWKPVLEGMHDKSIPTNHPSLCKVKAEPQESKGQENSRAGENNVEKSNASRRKLVVVEKEDTAGGENSSSVHKFRLAKDDPKRLLPRAGIAMMMWSSDGMFLATRDDEKPFVVWIWQPCNLEPFAVIELPGKVMSFKWDPVRPRLAIVCGEPFAYIWTPVLVGESATFKIDKAFPRSSLKQNASNEDQQGEQQWKEPCLGVRWSPLGDSLLMVSKSEACFALLPSAV